MKSNRLVPLIILFVAGCMGSRPPLPPGSRVVPPATWRKDTGTANTANAAIREAWWVEFGDPALDRLVESALSRNDDLQIAVARVAEARAALAIARASLLPRINATATGEREAGISPFGLENQQTTGGFGASIAYDADVFGRLRSEKAAASARFLASEAVRDTVRLSVAAAAAASYISLRALDARLAISESTLTVRAESLRVAQRRYSSGYSTALELEQAKAEYLATEQLIPELQSAISTQENALAVLLSNTPDAVPRGQSLEDLTAPTPPHTLPSTLIRQRPDIYAAEQQLVAADHTLTAARAAFLPNVALEAGAGRAFSTLYPEPITLWSLGGSILAPLFEGGALRARQDSAAAQRDQAAFAYRRTVLIAFREVEDQMTLVRFTSDQIQILVAEQNALAAAARLATRRYRAGYSSYLDQLDSERGLLNAQLAVVQMKANRLLAQVDLFRALGGGWHPPSLSSADMQTAADLSN